MENTAQSELEVELDKHLTSRCEDCLLTFSISEGFRQHSKACPALSLDAYRKYLKITFKEGVVFECKLCTSGCQRRPDAEWWSQYEGQIVCMCCNNGMQTNITLHLHSGNDGGVVCGVCVEELQSDRIRDHLLKHVKLRSYLFKICSKKCLDKHLNASEIQRLNRFPQKVSCFVCLMSNNTMHRLQVHLLSHGIDSGKVKCPIPSCFVWFTQDNLQRHMLNRHKDEPPTGYQEGTACQCAHCFLDFVSLDQLSVHIFTEHFGIETENLSQPIQPSRLVPHYTAGSNVGIGLEEEAGLQMDDVVEGSVDVMIASTLTCCRCPSVFTSFEALDTHYSLVHADTTVHCQGLLPFAGESQENSISSHQCSQCDNISRNERALFLHVAERHAPIKTTECVKHFRQSFMPGKLFGCRHCDLPVSPRIECVEFKKRLMMCVNCAVIFELDISHHLHETADGKIVCGFCSDIVDPEVTYKHVISHLFYQSYVAEICSSACLETRLAHVPPSFKTMSRFLCVICLSIQKNGQQFWNHINSHIRNLPGKPSTLEPKKTSQPKVCRRGLARTVSSYKDYLTSTFEAEKVFDCRCCDLPRASELEMFNTKAAEIKCYNCRKVFSSDTSCHIHKREDELVCGFCSKTVTSESVYKHLEDHQYRRSCLADICSRSCLDVVLSTWPDRLSEVKGRFKCLICFAVYNELYSLRDHVLVRHKPELQLFMCTHCQKRFPSHWKLSNHMSCTHRKLLKCPLCDKTFSEMGRFEYHLKNIHAEAIHLQCVECDGVLPDQFAYLEHYKTHMDSRYQCSICSETFSSMVALIGHKCKHSASKRCTICRADFPDLESLHSHIKFCKVSYICAHCQGSFTALRHLRDHINFVHFTLQCRLDEPYKCKSCTKVFYSRKQLTTHCSSKHTGPRMCSVCGETVPYIGMGMHMSYFHKPPQFECPECKKCFKTKNHLKQHVFYNHTNDFPFKCNNCGNSFRRNSNLTEHKKNTCKAR